mgnify:CR=1 FL=1
MGFNISGLVIDKNYENKILELQQILDYELTFDKEVNFEEASENWKSDKYCDIYFSEKIKKQYGKQKFIHKCY